MYTTVWKFLVREERLADFERAYGPDGEWVRLFRRAPGFIRTELFRNVSSVREYLTIDVWESSEAYDRFRAGSADDYASLDERFEELTEQEEHLVSASA